MLLLVMPPERDERRHLAPYLLGRRVDQPGHRLIDMIAISRDIGAGGARQQPALRPRMTWPLGLVIGIEQIVECRVEHPVGAVETRQDEGLEKPGRMREVPFC